MGGKAKSVVLVIGAEAGLEEVEGADPEAGATELKSAEGASRSSLEPPLAETRPVVTAAAGTGVATGSVVEDGCVVEDCGTGGTSSIPFAGLAEGGGGMASKSVGFIGGGGAEALAAG